VLNWHSNTILQSACAYLPAFSFFGNQSSSLHLHPPLRNICYSQPRHHATNQNTTLTSLLSLISSLALASSNFPTTTLLCSKHNCSVLAEVLGHRVDVECYVPIHSRCFPMPRLEDEPEQSWRSRATRWYDSFVNFALRDNVLEVAVGLMYVYQVHMKRCGYCADYTKTCCLFHCRRQFPRVRHYPTSRVFASLHRSKHRRKFPYLKSRS